MDYNREDPLLSLVNASMIQFQCDSCKTFYAVKPELAGKNAKCKMCGHVITIPTASISDEVVEAVVVDDSRPRESLGAVGPGKFSSTSSRPHSVPPVRQSPAVQAPTSSVASHTKPTSSNGTQARPQSTNPSVGSRTTAGNIGQSTQQANRSSASNPKNSVASAGVPQRSVNELLAAIQGPIQKVPLTMQYRVGLGLSAFLMVLLPVIYISIIFVVGMAVFYHTMFNGVIFSNSPRGRGAVGVFIVYLGPILIGGLLLLFMVKPIFARPSREDRGRSLTRQGEPKLFAFIDQLCASVHAPVPSRIDVDCSVNASASFRRGIWSMFGNDLVLTIGMPLVAGLNARELAGVLAHEFGHFSQGFGMRLSYLIRTINIWFVRVVYQRDQWDDRLQRWAREIDIRLGIVLYIAMGLIWLTRKILWLLMMLGHIVCSYLMRQMEYDADLHECRFAGSDSFESTATKLRLLSIAFEQSMSDQHAFYLDGKLCNDLPGLSVVNYENLDEEVISIVRNAAEKEKTGWMETHPSDADRIQAARKENAPGVFRMTDPASVLFTHYDAACVGVTQDLLKGVLGESYDPKMLVDLSKLVSQKSKTTEGQKAMREVFGAPFRVIRPIDLSAAKSMNTLSGREFVEALQSARTEMLAGRSTYAEQAAELDKIDDQWIAVNQAVVFLDLGATLDQKDFNFPVKNASQARAHDAKVRGQLTQKSSDMGTFESCFVRRSCAAIRLLRAKQIAERVPDVESHYNTSTMAFNTLDVLQSHLKPFFSARNSLISISPLLQFLNSDEHSAEFLSKMMALSSEMCRATIELEDALQHTTFPFEHPDGRISVGKYLVPKRPISEDFLASASAVQKMIEQFNFLYIRCIGTLALTCLLVEDALGLERQPMPKSATESPGSTN